MAANRERQPRCRCRLPGRAGVEKGERWGGPAPARRRRTPPPHRVESGERNRSLHRPGQAAVDTRVSGDRAPETVSSGPSPVTFQAEHPQRTDLSARRRGCAGHLRSSMPAAPARPTTTARTSARLGLRFRAGDRHRGIWTGVGGHGAATTRRSPLTIRPAAPHLPPWRDVTVRGDYRPSSAG